jgi:hypothetical protein
MAKKIPENLGEKKFSGKIVIYVSDWETRLIHATNRTHGQTGKT